MEGKRLKQETIIPARGGGALLAAKGDLVQIIDPKGQQVADLIAFCQDNPAEYFSPAHTCSCLTAVTLKVGDHLFSNHRNPLMKIVEDTVGRHDLIVPCCDPERYQRDFGLPDHPSCLVNLVQGLKQIGISQEVHGELAWNVFMNNRLTPEGRIVTEEPPHGPGSYILLEVLRELVIAISACPQDLTPCNAFNPTEIQVKVFS